MSEIRLIVFDGDAVYRDMNGKSWPQGQVLQPEVLRAGSVTVPYAALHYTRKVYPDETEVAFREVGRRGVELVEVNPSFGVASSISASLAEWASFNDPDDVELVLYTYDLKVIPMLRVLRRQGLRIHLIGGTRVADSYYLHQALVDEAVSVTRPGDWAELLGPG